ncbi:hypothetical protein [Streptomyces sp. NPDC048577]|uniref:hypothetical protein n=1 Tax=Streptomyces sp. NPDC048577 TaxID=3157209 RepID=UPI003432FF60
MGTSAFIARPTKAGYAGVHVQYDGSPPMILPLLLAAYRFRFEGDVEAMSRHLVDGVFAWDTIGTDLLDGAPPALVARLTGGEERSSQEMTDVLDDDSKPAKRLLVTHKNSAGHIWGYVLHRAGIEVISRQLDIRGPVVLWHNDPRARFGGEMALWTLSTPPPISMPLDLPRLTPVPAKPTPSPKAAPAQPRL